MNRYMAYTRAQGWLAAALLALGFAGAAAAVPTPLERTRAVLDETRRIVDSSRPHNEKLAELSRLLTGFLDTDTMGRAALGDNASKFDATQRKEFLTLFRELFQRTYVQKLLLFDKPDFEYEGERVSGDTAVVETSIVTPGDEFAVAYNLRREGDRWLATDIRIEDLSLTENFRRQIAALLAKSSVESVLDRMRRKYGSGGAGTAEGDGL